MACFEQELAEQLRRRLDRRGQPEGRGQLSLGFGGRIQDRERFVATSGGERDQPGELAFHDRDRRTQIPFALVVLLRGERHTRALGERRIAAVRRAHPDGEELVDVREIALVGEHRPARCLDRVAGAHRRQVAQERQLPGRLDDRLDVGERVARLAVAPLLDQLVLEPCERVIVAQRRRQPLTRDPRVRRAERGGVRRRRLAPESELQKNVGRHVQRMAGLGRELRERARRVDRLVCVRGVVVVVQQVMKRAGMIRMRPQNLPQDLVHACLCLAAGKRRAMSFVRIHVADEAARHRAEQRERI